MKAILGFCFMALMLLAVLYDAWANAVLYSYCWDWFIAPMFPGLPTPSTEQFVAVAMVKQAIKQKTIDQSSKDDTKLAERLGTLVGAMLLPWIYIFLGWIVHLVWVPGPYLLP